jgi:hypothetical protein
MERKATLAPRAETESRRTTLPMESCVIAKLCKGYPTPLNIFFFSTDFLPMILFPAKSAHFRNAVSQHAVRQRFKAAGIRHPAIERQPRILPPPLTRRRQNDKVWREGAGWSE